MDYQIEPIEVEGFTDANGVYKNEYGAWLGECDGELVLPYCDDAGDFIEAPEGWRDLIIRKLHDDDR